jgi:hypothetical protein
MILRSTVAHRIEEVAAVAVEAAVALEEEGEGRLRDLEEEEMAAAVARPRLSVVIQGTGPVRRVGTKTGRNALSATAAMHQSRLISRAHHLARLRLVGGWQAAGRRRIIIIIISSSSSSSSSSRRG